MSVDSSFDKKVKYKLEELDYERSKSRCKMRRILPGWRVLKKGRDRAQQP
jgi:hypothetical protein